MFLEQLSQISKRIGGTLALSLVDRDGIPIESVSSNPDIDIELLAAELVTQVRNMNESYSELSVGELQQYTVSTDRLTLMVSSVTSDYYLLLVLSRDGNRGRARFELRRARLLLEEELR